MKAPSILILSILLITWSCNNSVNHNESHSAGHSHELPATERLPIVLDTLEKQVVGAGVNSPEYIQLATGIEIIPDIRDAVSTVGVLTHEGIFGPLLFAERSRAFFIELKPGMFLSEHPHPTESLVYTVSGSWVLCSEAKRQVMNAGSLFHFGDNMPTGWEAPFEGGALLLVVKTKEEGANYDDYMAGLREMVGELDAERKNGTAFYYNELSEDHPAIQFARSVNPDFDKVLESIEY